MITVRISSPLSRYALLIAVTLAATSSSGNRWKTSLPRAIGTVEYGRLPRIGAHLRLDGAGEQATVYTHGTVSCAHACQYRATHGHSRTMNGKRTCTVSVGGRARRRWELPALFWLAALSSLLDNRLIALADIELGHEGQVGRHRLADIYDSPGAVCDIVLPGRDSLGETWLRVNPPIMFARNRTAGTDEQYVSWRANVSALNEETGVWRVVRRSGMPRDLANDQLASYFDGEGWLAEFPLSRATYSVSVEMIWYDPHSPDRVEGRATHEIEHFTLVFRHDGETRHGRTSSVCRAPR
jgi:hypothetical protein